MAMLIKCMKQKKDGSIESRTAHSLNPVPFIVYGKDVEIKNGNFGLANVAASVVKLLGIEPLEVWEESIIK